MFRTKHILAASIAVLIGQIGGCAAESTPDVQTNTADAPSPAQNQGRVSQTTQQNQADDASTPGTAKNVILFVGDGMGLSTVTAARIHAGQTRGEDGESNRLSFERFPRSAFVSTYNHDSQVPDSAGTATQMMSGYRARIGQINVEPAPPAVNDGMDPRLGWCVGPNPPTILDRAKAKGLRVGAVSTARITHATPAAVYAHSPDRGWESPGDVPEEAREAGCTSIAEQLLTSKIDLAIGGGGREFEDIPKVQAGFDRDSLAFELEQGLPAFAFLSESHLPYEADRPDSDLSLTELTEIAIDALDNDEGYFLLVEAGRIDHAHHGTNAFRALEDTVELDRAVQKAVDMTEDDTLILVTADHGHVFTMAGYPARGNPILGYARATDRATGRLADEPLYDLDGKPYTTLGYHNGGTPAGQNLEPTDPDYRQKVAVRLDSETHSGEDVPLYATGPGSKRVGGVMDQPDIAGVIDAALGLESNARNAD